jgi:hypothetical protein
MPSVVAVRLWPAVSPGAAENRVIPKRAAVSDPCNTGRCLSKWSHTEGTGSYG